MSKLQGEREREREREREEKKQDLSPCPNISVIDYAISSTEGLKGFRVLKLWNWTPFILMVMLC